MSRDKIARFAVSKYILRGFSAERGPFYLRQAKTYSNVLKGLDNDIIDRAGEVSLSLSDSSDTSWTYESSSGHTVIIEMDPRDMGIEDPDVLVSCSCPFWQYQGPEYYAKKENYLNGDPRGLATKPDQTDPEGDNFLCKHAYKALTETFD
jgi:hypothetical protein